MKINIFKYLFILYLKFKIFIYNFYQIYSFLDTDKCLIQNLKESFQIGTKPFESFSISTFLCNTAHEYLNGSCVSFIPILFCINS